MKIRLSAFLFILLTGFLFSNTEAQEHFVYIQSENGSPFYVKVNNSSVKSSTANGYLILPKLDKGEYSLVVGLPQNKLPEAAFDVSINSEKGNQGLLLRDQGDELRLENLVTKKSITPKNVANSPDSPINTTPPKDHNGDTFLEDLLASREKRAQKETTTVEKDSILKKDTIAPTISKKEEVDQPKEKDEIKPKDEPLATTEEKKSEEKAETEGEEVLLAKEEKNVNDIDSFEGMLNAITKDNVMPELNDEVPVEKEEKKEDSQVKKAKKTLEKINEDNQDADSDVVVAVDKEESSDSKMHSPEQDISSDNLSSEKIVSGDKKEQEQIREEDKEDSSLQDTPSGDIAKQTEEDAKSEEKRSHFFDLIGDGAQDEATTKKTDARPPSENIASSSAAESRSKEEVAQSGDLSFIDFDQPKNEKTASSTKGNKGTKKESVFDRLLKKIEDTTQDRSSRSLAKPLFEKEKEVGANKDLESGVEEQMQTTRPTSSISCSGLNDQEQFDKIRRKMAGKKGDEALLRYAKRALSGEGCYTNDQIKDLTYLFNSEEYRMEFLKLAYPHSSDQSNFTSLVNTLTSNPYKREFQSTFK